MIPDDVNLKSLWSRGFVNVFVRGYSYPAGRDSVHAGTCLDVLEGKERFCFSS